MNKRCSLFKSLLKNHFTLVNRARYEHRRVITLLDSYSLQKLEGTPFLVATWQDVLILFHPGCRVVPVGDFLSPSSSISYWVFTYTSDIGNSN